MSEPFIFDLLPGKTIGGAEGRKKVQQFLQASDLRV
jgi:hypothetical protein